MMWLTWSAQKRRGGDGRLRVRAARRYNGGNSSACTVGSPQSSLPSELRMLHDADRLLRNDCDARRSRYAKAYVELRKCVADVAMMMCRKRLGLVAGAGRCPSERTFAFIGERTRAITTSLTLHHHKWSLLAAFVVGPILSSQQSL
ncbi:hypothetical protein KGM_213016 [Danaus plexippus plexippus]|uniref:Uncharacterized protein n=1 Tax=Danaus plexippus plexippus TaxID=278856 RepID=A0A212F9I0_DANPL|nr:hypothetical protein KGM_213016 [Danaus plexippus plexippus]